MTIKLKPGLVLKEFRSGGDVVRLRLLKRDDLGGATKYINSLVEERAFIGMQKKQSLKQEKGWLSKSLSDMKKGKSATVVVEVNGKFMGSAGVARKPLDATSHVCTLGLGIHNTMRNKGIGTILMKTLLRLGKESLKCRIAELSVYEPNLIAKRLYEKSGFRETGKIPNGCNYYGKFYDETIMVREL